MPNANADGATGRVVFAAADGQSLSKARRSSRRSRRLATVPDVASASIRSPPAPSPRTAGSPTPTCSSRSAQADVTATQTDAIEAATHAASAAGLQVEYGGVGRAGRGRAADRRGARRASSPWLVLTITFGSLLAAGLPLLTALVGVGIGTLGIQLASGLTDLTSTVDRRWPRCSASPSASTTRCSSSPATARRCATAWAIEESIALAVGTAGSAVVFAGSTVIIALVALVVTGVPFLAADGHRRRRRVAIAVLLASRSSRRCSASRARASLRGKTFSSRRVASATHGRALGGDRHAPPACSPTGAVVVALGALAIPALDVRLGLPNDGTAEPRHDRSARPTTSSPRASASASTAS